MAVLADLERLLERIFERSTARLFRAHPQPVQIERRVERAMERARVTTAGRITVPVRYRVRLEPADLADVAQASGGPDLLAGRLADAAFAFARAHGYHLPDRPSVALVADPGVERGVIEVDPVAPPRPSAVPARPASAPPVPVVPDIPIVPARVAAAPVAAVDADATGPPASTGRPATGSAGAVGPGPEPAGPPAMPGPSPAADGPAVAGSAAASPAAGAAPAVPGTGPAVPGPRGGIRGDGTSTLVFRRPAPVPTRAVLRVLPRGGGERTIEVDGTPLTLGRASDNGLVLADPRVSRHHARLQARHGTLVLADLGSTNGSRVNGVRVDECALGTGDRILLGDTVLVVEQLPD